MSAITIIIPRAETIISIAPGKPAAIVKPAVAPADPHRFADAMETAFTGLVFTGAALFAAGLLHIAAPSCTARLIGLDALYALAALTGAITLVAMARGFAGR
jgi:hypothetical protein